MFVMNSLANLSDCFRNELKNIGVKLAEYLVSQQLVCW
jgi:hypothetical protein